MEWLPYIAADIQASPLKKWKFLGSSLQLSKADLNGIESDNDEEYERCYKMLAKWYKQSSAPSFKDLADALEEEKLYEIRENYCVLGHDPPTQKIVQHVGKLFTCFRSLFKSNISLRFALLIFTPAITNRTNNTVKVLVSPGGPYFFSDL